VAGLLEEVCVDVECDRDACVAEDAADLGDVESEVDDQVAGEVWRSSWTEGRDLRALLGSALGSLYAARFHERVAAYLRSGQDGDFAASETASYAYGVAEAERRGNYRALKKLHEVGPPPHTVEQLMTERTWVMRLEGGMRPKA
jgi:hypothetical protein